MSNRFAWLLGVVALVMAALLVSCGSLYNPASNGLVVVGSQGSDLLETFSFDLANGSAAEISNPPESTDLQTCVLNGRPSSMLLDPAGVYVYVIMLTDTLCPNSTGNGIQPFKVNSDGTIKQAGQFVPDPNPIALTMDSKGQFLFVAEGGTVNVYAIGGSASLTPVSPTFNFVLPPGFGSPNIIAIATTPTLFPGIGINGVQNSVCAQPGINPPTNEFLYAADAENNVIWEYNVDTSSGALGNPPSQTQVPFFTGTGTRLLTVPSGVAVDPCDRFVYVSNTGSNQITGYAMCNGSATEIQAVCTNGLADGSLVPVSGSPFNLSGGANGPGPLVVDPFGNYVYVLETLSNQISSFKISPVSGNLSPLSNPNVGTSTQPKSIAIRSDDSWVFVTNYLPATISRFTVTPATGVLVPQPEITTDNQPFGLALK